MYSRWHLHSQPDPKMTIDNIEQQDDQYTLLELALRLRWHSVPPRAHRCPDEISDQDEDGLNVLHWACCHPPPLDVFQGLLRHKKQIREAACTPDSNGLTPLLCACSCGAPLEIIALLIEACPECLALVDKEGWTALHYACHRARRGVYGLGIALRMSEILLAADPTMAAVRDVTGNTPLHTLCGLFEMDILEFQMPLSCSLRTHLLGREPHMSYFWKLVSMMAEAASPNLEESSSLLNSLVAFPSVPTDLLHFACIQFPEELLLLDSSGNSPLHNSIARGAAHIGTIFVRYESHAATIKNHAGETPLMMSTHRFSSFNEVINQLLRLDLSGVDCLPQLQDVHFPTLLSRVSDDASVLFAMVRARPSLARRTVLTT